MFGFRLCPKCKGDIFLDHDLDDWMMVCLQCGHRIYLGQHRDSQIAMSLAHSLLQLAANYPESIDTQISIKETAAV